MFDQSDDYFWVVDNPSVSATSHIYPLFQSLQGKHELSVNMTWTDLQVLIMEVQPNN